MIADRKNTLQNDNSLLSGAKSTKSNKGNGIGHLKPKDMKLKKINTRNLDNGARSKTVEPGMKPQIIDDQSLMSPS